MSNRMDIERAVMKELPKRVVLGHLPSGRPGHWEAVASDPFLTSLATEAMAGSLFFWSLKPASIFRACHL